MRRPPHADVGGTNARAAMPNLKFPLGCLVSARAIDEAASAVGAAPPRAERRMLERACAVVSTFVASSARASVEAVADKWATPGV